MRTDARAGSQPSHINGPLVGPAGPVKTDAVKHAFDRGQFFQGLGPEHVGDDRLDAKPGDL